MEKFDITTDQWIEIHKTLRDKMPLHCIAELKNIFEIHPNEKMLKMMQEIRENIQSGKVK